MDKKKKEAKGMLRQNNGDRCCTWLFDIFKDKEKTMKKEEGKDE